MKTGQIIGGILIATGFGAVIYYGFIKKFDDGLTGFQKLIVKKDANTTTGLTASSVTVKTQPSGSNVMDSTSNPNADLGLITKENLPSTGFKSNAEGNAFRDWFNNNYPTTAKNLQLDRTGSYDNDFIRKAYSMYGTKYKDYLKTQEGIAFIKKYGNFLNL